MGFKQYKISDTVTFYDLPDAGMAVTVTKAVEEMKENFRTKQDELKVVLDFKECKPLVCTNKNLDLLDEAYPHLDVPKIPGHKLWLNPVTIEVAGENKFIVRIDPMQTLRMQPDPSQQASEDSSGQGAPAGEDRDADAPSADIPF